MKKCFYLASLLAFCFLSVSVNVQAQTPVITLNPVSQEVCSGNMAQFFIAANDTPTGYYWQVSTDGGASWAILTDGSQYSGSATDTLWVTSMLSLSTYQYRGVALNGSFSSAASSAALLTVDTSYVAPVSGLSIVCTGTTITLTDVSPGGTWGEMHSSLDTISSTGVLHGIAMGMDTITYAVANSCGSNAVTYPVTISALSTVAAISGASNVCAGSSVTLTDASTGGTWSNRFPAIDTVSTTGIVYGLSRGTDTIKYSVTNYCGTTTVWSLVTVDTSFVPTITGPSAVCAGTHITLNDATMGGTWSNVHSSVDTVNSSWGIVYGLSMGMDTIKYTITNSCGTMMVWSLITVDTLPAAISGSTALCTGSSVTLSNSIPGGSWSRLHSYTDTISTTGVLKGLHGGMDTISYSLTNSCGTRSAQLPILVDTLPVIRAISGPSAVCAGSHISLMDSTAGGTWSNQFMAIDTINGIGVVYGLSHGIDTIKYTITNTCGATIKVKAIKTDTLPAAITGPSVVCVGSSITLSDIATGGKWRVKHPRMTHSGFDVIGVNTGILTGDSVGVDTVVYIDSNTCGADSVTKIITITNSLPIVAAITGNSAVCSGSAITLADATPGGTWSNHLPMNDTINSAGIDYGISVGVDTIYYSLSNECGTTKVKKTITIDSARSLFTISGLSAVCVGATIVLTKTTINGGTWTQSNSGLATVHGTTYGDVTGLSAGIDTIKYTITNSCGVFLAKHVVKVDTLTTAGTISGANGICGGARDTLHESAILGTWSSIHTSIATISATGVVMGVSAGMDSIEYSITNSCGTRNKFMAITIFQAPNAGTISGKTGVCSGSSISLHDTTRGGIWYNRHNSLDNFSVYARDSIKITGLSAGIDTISYIFTDTSVHNCGTDTARYIVHIDTFTHAHPITGLTHVCVASSVNLSSSPSGGSWISKVPAIGTIDSSGKFTGVSAGLDSIFYIYANACGRDTVKTVDTILLLPIAGTITGPNAVCHGDTAVMSDAITGGTWSVSNTTLGTIGSTGKFASINPGTDTIYYRVTNTNCSNKAWFAERIDTVPPSYPITGPTTVCVGSIIILDNMNTWGTHVWATSNSRASITAAGVVTGISASLDTIMYNFSNSCGGDTESYVVTVDTLLGNGSLIGTSFVCLGTQITLTDTSTGGIWLSSNPYIASIDGTGTYTALITGRNVGNVVISYTYWNACGATTDTQNIQVYGEALPIMGNDSVGQTSTRILTDATPGGIWTSTNTSIATVDSTGKVRGSGSGSTITVDTIIYTVTNPCGTSSAMMTLYVGPAPSAGNIYGKDSHGKDTVCTGLNIDLIDTNATANTHFTWSSKYGNATVNSYGVVTGVVGAGLDSITYATLNIMDTGKAFKVVSAGLDTIVYTATNGFGTTKVTHGIYVNSIPIVRVSRYPSIIIGGQYPMIDTPNTGTWWSSDNSSIIFHTGADGNPAMIVLSGTKDTTGLDTLVYTVQNLCGTTRDTIIYYLPFVSGIKNITDPVSAINVFPNPGNGTLTVSFTSSIEEEADVTISNIVGQKVKEFTIKSNTLSEINIDHPDGIYLLTATTPNSKYDIKIVVRR